MSDIDLRDDDNGDLDEIVLLNPTCVHFERMDEDSLWCGVCMKDGKMVHVRIFVEGYKLSFFAEVE